MPTPPVARTLAKLIFHIESTYLGNAILCSIAHKTILGTIVLLYSEMIRRRLAPFATHPASGCKSTADEVSFSVLALLTGWPTGLASRKPKPSPTTE